MILIDLKNSLSSQKKDYKGEDKNWEEKEDNEAEDFQNHTLNI